MTENIRTAQPNGKTFALCSRSAMQSDAHHVYSRCTMCILRIPCNVHSAIASHVCSVATSKFFFPFERLPPWKCFNIHRTANASYWQTFSNFINLEKNVFQCALYQLACCTWLFPLLLSFDECNKRGCMGAALEHRIWGGRRPLYVQKEYRFRNIP